MLDKIASGVGVEGMESLLPALDARPAGAAHRAGAEPGTHVLLGDPERIRRRAEDLVRTGQEFLAASWMAAATGGRAPIDLDESAYRELDDVLDTIRDRELPIWTLAQFGQEDATDARRVTAAAGLSG